MRGAEQPLLEENVNLYTSLSKCVVDDIHRSGPMTVMKVEIGEIGVASANRARFLHEFAGIDAILMDRSQREQPPLFTIAADSRAATITAARPLASDLPACSIRNAYCQLPSPLSRRSA